MKFLSISLAVVMLLTTESVEATQLRTIKQSSIEESKLDEATKSSVKKAAAAALKVAVAAKKAESQESIKNDMKAVHKAEKKEDADAIMESVDKAAQEEEKKAVQAKSSSSVRPEYLEAAETGVFDTRGPVGQIWAKLQKDDPDKVNYSQNAGKQLRRTTESAGLWRSSNISGWRTGSAKASARSTVHRVNISS